MKTNNRKFLSTIILTGVIALCSSMNVFATPLQDKMKPAESKMQPAKPKMADKKKPAAKMKAKKAKVDKMAMDTAGKM
ncbi:hypothetical protein [Mucilaginibacter sp.]|uniref:hypothetical protein n=1 Tax=Mucilaginibacter sp. TaxID=1882438 RepID=UPI0035BC1FBC